MAYNYQPQMASTAVAVGQMITRSAESVANMQMEGAKMRAQMRMQAASTNAEIITQGWATRANLAMERYKANLSASVSREQIAASRAASAASNALGYAQLRLEGYKADRSDSLARDKMERDDVRAVESENRADQRASDSTAADKYKTDQLDSRARDKLAWEKEKFKYTPGYAAEEDRKRKLAASERGEVALGDASGGKVPVAGARTGVFEAWGNNTPKLKLHGGTQEDLDNPWYSTYLTTDEQKKRAETFKRLNKPVLSGAEFKERDSIVAELANPEAIKAFDARRKGVEKHVINSLGTPDVFGEFGEMSVMMPSADGKRMVTVGTSARRASKLPSVVQNAVDQYDQAAAIAGAPVPLDAGAQHTFMLQVSNFAVMAETVASADRDTKAVKSLMGMATAPASKTAIQEDPRVFQDEESPLDNPVARLLSSWNNQ